MVSADTNGMTARRTRAAGERTSACLTSLPTNNIVAAHMAIRVVARLGSFGTKTKSDILTTYSSRKHLDVMTPRK